MGHGCGRPKRERTEHNYCPDYQAPLGKQRSPSAILIRGNAGIMRHTKLHRHVKSSLTRGTRGRRARQPGTRTSLVRGVPSTLSYMDASPCCEGVISPESPYTDDPKAIETLVRLSYAGCFHRRGKKLRHFRKFLYISVTTSR